MKVYTPVFEIDEDKFIILGTDMAIWCEDLARLLGKQASVELDLDFSGELLGAEQTGEDCLTYDQVYAPFEVGDGVMIGFISGPLFDLLLDSQEEENSEEAFNGYSSDEG